MFLSAKKGFTLIELLVVIAIISLLSSVVLTSLQSAKLKAKDSQRLTEMKQIQKALEFYYDDHKHYPSVTTWTCFGCTNLTYRDQDILAPTPAPDIASALRPYLSKDPIDPKGAVSGGYYYTSKANGTDYCFMIHTTVDDLRNFPSTMLNGFRCGGIGSDGKCNSPGSGGSTVNTVFIMSGSPATLFQSPNGC